MARGYEAVDMRDIARAVGKQPARICRLNLSKAGVLAESIIALNQARIAQLPGIGTLNCIGHQHASAPSGSAEDGLAAKSPDPFSQLATSALC